MVWNTAVCIDFQTLHQDETYTLHAAERLISIFLPFCYFFLGLLCVCIAANYLWFVVLSLFYFEICSTLILESGAYVHARVAQSKDHALEYLVNELAGLSLSACISIFVCLQTALLPSLRFSILVYVPRLQWIV